MNWEALTAVSTAFTGFVILLTVIYAARQVGALNEQSKALGAQLEHLRRATQLNGTLAVFDELFSPDLIDAYQFVMNDFDERIKDKRFHEEACGLAPDAETHKEVQILRHMERIGTLIKNDLLEANVVLDFAGYVIETTWKKLEPIALEQRRRRGEKLWENFEFLAAQAAIVNASAGRH